MHPLRCLLPAVPAAPIQLGASGYPAVMLSRATAAAALLATPVAVFAGCSSSQTNSEQTSTSSTTTTSSVSPSAENIKAELKTADGKPVANATIDFANGYATVTVETVAGG